MTSMKRTAAALVGLALVLAVPVAVRPAAADGAADADPDGPVVDLGWEIVTSPPGADAPEATPGPDATSGVRPRSVPAPEAGGDELTAETPGGEQPEVPEARTELVPIVPFRDPRWVDLSGCGLDALTCLLARKHQAEGHFMWQGGRIFLTHDGRRVQGDPAHTWPEYQRQAALLAAYLNAVDAARLEEQRRAGLVDRWSGVANCESGGRWDAVGPGYYGGLQFSLSTWRAYGGQGYPHHQPAWYQAEIADRVRVSSGLGHWPHCGRYYG